VSSCETELRCVFSGFQSMECRCNAVLLGPGIRPPLLRSVWSYSTARGLSSGLRRHGPVPAGSKRSVCL
ncbi:hypothetical protein XENOCAPTIV_025079, partial [Xenoophorus captivus]